MNIHCTACVESACHTNIKGAEKKYVPKIFWQYFVIKSSNVLVLFETARIVWIFFM